MVDANELMEPWQEQRRGRGWFVLLLGVVVFAVFGAVVGYAYWRGLPGIGGEPPLIKAEEGPYRLAPSDRGGLAVPNANSSIVTVLRPHGDPPRVEQLLPPEAATPLESAEPDIDAAPPITALATPDDGSGASAAPDATPASPLDAGETTGAVVSGTPYPRSKPPQPEPVADLEQAETTISALPPVEPAAPPAESTAVVAPPEAQEAPAAVPAPASEPAVPASAPQRLVRVDPAVPATVRPAAGGVYRLQLAAVRSEGGLTQAWAELRQRYPDALGGVNPQVERTDTTSGPLFRLQAGPFTSREAASDACGSIRGSGGQCFIVGPIGQ